MIKVDKNVSAIPESLIPAFLDLFPGKLAIPVISRTTHQKRMAVIEGETYIDTDEYNSRYKIADIKTSLKGIYNSKCAYCEQKVEQWHVEHYRPKNIYYWLAYSWDNLIIACATCNQHKGIHFELIGTRVQFTNTETNIRSINVSSANCNMVEKPKMVNPEISDPLGLISFERDGIIKSSDVSFKYTIEKCKIDRKYLNDERRKLLEIFERDIRSALIENSDVTDQEKEITIIVKKFINDSRDVELQFLAFRRFAVSSGWLNEITKELN